MANKNQPANKPSVPDDRERTIGGDMPKRTPPTVTIARITLVGTIIVATTSLIGNLILGYWQFIQPSDGHPPTPTPIPTSLAMEAIPRDVFVFAGDDNPDGG